MQRPLDLYSLFRLKDTKLVGEMNRLMSGKTSAVRKHELESLRGLCDALISAGSTLSELDGYYFSYSIPKIGKEFDVLRFSDDTVLNIELKYVNVGEAEIAEQQKRNEYYLRALGKRIFICTYVCDENRFYTLDKSGILADCPVKSVIDVIKRTNSFYTGDPDRLFDPEDYIFSPCSDPERLLEGRYFLTQHQETIKKRLISLANKVSPRYACVSGGSGTGKTLLLYDVALSVAHTEKVCVITADVDSDEVINKAIPSITVTDAEGYLSMSAEERNYGVIFIDDAHRIPPASLDFIVEDARKKGRLCVFFTDAPILLCATERTARFWRKLKRLVGTEKHQLTDRIRTDPTIAAFTNRMLVADALSCRVEGVAYGDVFVLYAATKAEAALLSDKYANKGYICYAPDRPQKGKLPRGKRLILLGKKFHYSDDGKFCADGCSDADTLMENLVFEGLRGVDGSLGILVVGNLPLFRTLLEFFK